MLSPGAALLLSAVLVLANAFFVGAEFPFVKIRPTRVKELVNAGTARRLLATILGRLDVYLSANQLGVTLASLGLGWVGEPGGGARAPAASFELRRVDRSGQPHARSRHQLHVITFVHVTIGELVQVLRSAAGRAGRSVGRVPLRIFHLVAFPSSGYSRPSPT